MMSCWYSMLLRGRLLVFGAAKIVERWKLGVLTHWSKNLPKVFFPILIIFSPISGWGYGLFMHVFLFLDSTASAVTVRSTIRRLREQTESWNQFVFLILFSKSKLKFLCLFKIIINFYLDSWWRTKVWLVFVLCISDATLDSRMIFSFVVLVHLMVNELVAVSASCYSITLCYL